jgi:hypothetical protein
MVAFEKIKEVSKRRTARMNMNNALELITHDNQKVAVCIGQQLIFC